LDKCSNYIDGTIYNLKKGIEEIEKVTFDEDSLSQVSLLSFPRKVKMMKTLVRVHL